jgi:hypothetical protein
MTTTPKSPDAGELPESSWDKSQRDATRRWLESRPQYWKLVHAPMSGLLSFTTHSGPKAKELKS